MRRDLTVTVKRSLSKNCFCKKADKNFFAFNTNDILTGYKLIKSTGWADHIVDHPTSHGSVVLSIMTSVCPASNGEQTIASIAIPSVPVREPGRPAGSRSPIIIRFTQYSLRAHCQKSAESESN